MKSIVRLSWIDAAAPSDDDLSRLAVRRGRRLRRGLFAAVAVVGSPSVATVTYAYWATSGGGVSTALSLDNNRSVQLHVSTLSLDTSQGSGGYTADSGHSACSPSSAQLGFTPQSTGWTLEPMSSTAVTLGSAITMGAGSPSSCQGASFTVYLKVA